MTDEHEQPASADQRPATAADGTEPEPLPAQPGPAETAPDAPHGPQATDRPRASAEELRRPDPGGLVGPEVDPGEQAAG
ncbi:MAG: hypothetical protein AB7O92_10950 [Acidimicrobiia bacterium]